MRGAARVDPDLPVVVPLAPEIIRKQDGATKNDCEQNACAHLLTAFRREHPHLPVVILQDGLASKGPPIKMLRAHEIGYILGVKPGDHTVLFAWLEDNPRVQVTERCETGPKGQITHHRFRWVNDAPLNETHFDLGVNCLEYTEINPKGETKTFSWVTDQPLNDHSIMEVMRASRSRWKIENEPFQTLKTTRGSGLSFAHHFGHGQKNLASVLPTLMMLVFLMDQILQTLCPAFQRALATKKRKLYLWRAMTAQLLSDQIHSWEIFWRGLTETLQRPALADILPEP